MPPNTPDEARESPEAPDRFIGEDECERITDLSRVTRWRLMKRKLFPPKVRISPNRTAWRLSSVLRWMTEREAA